MFSNDVLSNLIGFFLFCFQYVFLALSLSCSQVIIHTRPGACYPHLNCFINKVVVVRVVVVVVLNLFRHQPFLYTFTPGSPSVIVGLYSLLLVLLCLIDFSPRLLLHFWFLLLSAYYFDQRFFILSYLTPSLRHASSLTLYPLTMHLLTINHALNVWFIKWKIKSAKLKWQSTVKILKY